MKRKIKGRLQQSRRKRAPRDRAPEVSDEELDRRALRMEQPRGLPALLSALQKMKGAGQS